VAAGVPSQQVASSTAVEQLYNAVLHCSVFGDERDSILARWNMLQAAWGSGKAVYSQTMPPIDLDEQNPLCRFKTIGYSALPSAKAEQGVLSAVIRKKPAELQPLKDQIAAGISSKLTYSTRTRLHFCAHELKIVSGLFGRHGMKTVIESIRPCGGGGGGGGANASSEVLFHVQENNPQTGQSKKIPSNDVFSFLSQPMNGQNLQRMGIESVSPKVSFTEKQIRDYLETPPKGIDPR
jgi:nuclear pore complex protein Nup54